MPQRGALACAGPHRQCCAVGGWRGRARAEGVGPTGRLVGLAREVRWGGFCLAVGWQCKLSVITPGLLYLYETRRPAT